jgi:hypothetical protein
MVDKNFVAAKKDKDIFVNNPFKGTVPQDFLQICPKIFEKKSKITLKIVSGTWGKMIHEKTFSKKIS